MSEEAATEEVIESAEEVIQEEVVETLSHDQIQEEKATKGGWLPRDQFIEKGNAPEKWSSAEVFNVRGEFIDRDREQKKQIAAFDQRLSNVNQMHGIQIEAQRKEYQDRKDEYATQGGEEGLKGVQNMDFQINKLNQAATVTTEAPIDPIYQAFNDKNDYMKTGGPKHSHAMASYNYAVNQGATPAQVVAYVEQEMGKAFPPTQNRQKETVAMSEGGTKPGGKSRQSSKEPTLADLSASDRKIFDSMGLNETQMLQALKDSGKD